MRHGWAALACAGLIVPGVIDVSASAEDGPPPLTAPVLTAPTTEPAAPASATPTPPPTPAPAPGQGSGAVLAVPGVTAPRSRPAPRPATPDQTRGRAIAPPRVEFPPVVEPLDATPTRDPTDPAPRRAGARTRPPVTLESVTAPNDDENEASPKPDTPARRAAKPARPEPLPRRPPGLFSRFFPPADGGRPASAPRLKDSVTVKPRTDPEADAALRKRVERQIRDNFGTRLRSYEVRVVDQEVTVRARAARFWQRRNLRYAIETLPALSGVKANVEVTD
jgi:hypothetical protein